MNTIDENAASHTSGYMYTLSTFLGDTLLTPPTILHDALELIKCHPNIDLFASRLNDHFELYCSYRPDPGAGFVDAFSISWSECHFYCFPPFSCILKVLQKIRQDRATGVIVVPKWPTHTWYSLLMSMLLVPP